MCVKRLWMIRLIVVMLTCFSRLVNMVLGNLRTKSCCNDSGSLNFCRVTLQKIDIKYKLLYNIHIECMTVT